MSAPHGEPLPPAADLARLKDYYQHTGAILVLLAEGGRVHDRHPRLASSVSHRARRLLGPLCQLLATIEDDLPAAPARDIRQA